MKKIALAIAVPLLALTAYLLLWPVPVEPVAWNAPPDAGHTGVHAPNQLLADLQVIPLGGEEGPEHVVLREGKLYVAVASGKILRLNPDGSGLEVFADSGGRVLGFDFDAAGRLIAADAVKGLLAIAPDGKVTLLTDKVNGDPIRYADAVVVARSGKIYFSDASTRFGPAQWGGTFEASILDALELSATGRILEYDPATNATRIVAKGLAFANGVTLSADERLLYVVETAKYRVWQVPVTSDHLDLAAGTPASAEARIFLDNLPGYPDNLMRGLDGRIWLGFVKPRNPTVDRMANQPWLRKVTLRLPRALWPIPKPYGHVMAFDDSGHIDAVLQDPSGAYPDTTGITETEERLYVQSLHAKGLGWRAR
jgi:sugar lactone lactonase YvrE